MLFAFTRSYVKILFFKEEKKLDLIAGWKERCECTELSLIPARNITLETKM